MGADTRYAKQKEMVTMSRKGGRTSSAKQQHTNKRTRTHTLDPKIVAYWDLSWAISISTGVHPSENIASIGSH